MRNASAVQIEPPGPYEGGHERRAPEALEALEGSERALRPQGSTLDWPMSWPAALYVGDTGFDCTVLDFSAAGAHVTMPDAPPASAEATLKFPFSVYLKGRIAWRRGGDLGLDFGPEAQRSARIVEDVLLNKAPSR